MLSHHVLDESGLVPFIAKILADLRPTEEIFPHSINHQDHYSIIVKICWLERCIIVLNVGNKEAFRTHCKAEYAYRDAKI